MARDDFPEGICLTSYALKDVRLALCPDRSSGIRVEGSDATAALLDEAAASC